jgi:CBS domain-containing protein
MNIPHTLAPIHDRSWRKSLMRVEQLMTKTVQSCRPHDSLEHAAQLMWSYDCGCLPVCAADGVSGVVGVVTDRDICMRALFQGKPLHGLRVADAMATQIVACHPSDAVADAEIAMRKAQVRRVPVVDEQNALVGIVSLADLAREADREQTAPHPEVTEEEITDTLAAICVPKGH